MSKPLHFFIAGIIQGSLPNTTHPQDYRREIMHLLADAYPGSAIFDPVEEYPDSLSYDDAKASAAFFDLMDRAGQGDVLIAFIPEASMGTAIELWNAHHEGCLVVAVTTLTKNWVIRYLSDHILPDLSSLKEFIHSGKMAEAIREKLKRE